MILKCGLRYMTYGVSKIVLHAINLHEDLTQVRLPLDVSAYIALAAFGSCRRTSGQKIDLKPYAFIAGIDPALVQNILDIANGELEPEIHHHRKLYDLGVMSWSNETHSEFIQIG